MKNLLISTLYIINGNYLSSPNIGIGQPIPSEKLEVSGIVFSNQGGIRFPDLSVQATAAYNSNTKDAAESRKFIVMEIQINGTVLQGEYTDSIFSEAIKVIGTEIRHSYTVEPGPGGAGFLTRGTRWNQFNITKEIDKTSPLLQAALFESQPINSLKLHFMEHNHWNQLVDYYRIEILNGNIYDISTQLVFKGKSSYPHVEHLSLIYTDVIFTAVEGGQEYQHSFSNQ